MEDEVSSSFKKLRKRADDFSHFIRRDIWERNRDQSWKGRSVMVLRVLSITISGIFSNRLFTRAAALSYSSLIALGPLIAIAVLTSSAFLQGTPEDNIKKGLLFVAPSLSDYIRIADDAGGPTDTPQPTQEEEMANALDQLINQIVEGAERIVGGVETGGKGIAGALGAATLIAAGILLLITIENTFNQIWGVQHGRSLGHRIVFYWTFISLGSVLGIAAFGLMSASTVAGMVEDLQLPFSHAVTSVILFVFPVLAFILVVFLLTLFYMFFPNTSVRLVPAFWGGLVVTALLFLNNFLSVLYVSSVIRFQSLYGSVGIIPVLMFGLYLFWACVLIGGQITYSAQNVNYLTGQQAWENISLRTRETLTLAVFLLVCRRFQESEPPLSSHQLGAIVQVPGHVLNECLERLQEIHFITAVEDHDDPVYAGQRYQPSRPLSRLTLGDFREAYRAHGNNAGSGELESHDPILVHYREKLTQTNKDLREESIETLLGRFPSERSIAQLIPDARGHTPATETLQQGSW